MALQDCIDHAREVSPEVLKKPCGREEAAPEAASSGASKKPAGRSAGVVCCAAPWLAVTAGDSSLLAVDCKVVGETLLSPWCTRVTCVEQLLC